MRDTRDYGLRELAHKYYMGKLSFESYRSERTRLLDKITGVTGGHESTRPIVSPLKSRHQAGRSPGDKYVSPWYLRGKVWLLIMLLTAIIVIAWGLGSGRFTLTSGLLDPIHTAVSWGDPGITGSNDSVKSRQFNG